MHAFKMQILSTAVDALQNMISYYMYAFKIQILLTVFDVIQSMWYITESCHIHACIVAQNGRNMGITLY